MKTRPEILAPAGDRDALAAALAAGADAVYFGLDDGFNARARAANFPSSELAEIVAWIHRAGVRAYVTLNTLVFEPELDVVEELIRRVAAAGTDAIIVQDPAVALLARAICPALEVHASTQMTASSALAAELLRGLGIARVVVPRELSVDEIRAYASATSLPLEVFVHGALCVAWSGQCLSSEAWGGRSANRGQCAQACRLPYGLVVDGDERDLGDVAYLLSPKDLVGLDVVGALAAIGPQIASLKIEGRLKGPHYVASAVAHYKRAVGTTPMTAHARALADELAADVALLHVAYSRGISTGFLHGTDHQRLVEGRFPRHRGLPLGRVVRVEPDAVVVAVDPAQRPRTGGRALAASVEDTPDDGAATIEPRAGMGVVFERGRPEEPEEGGPIFGVEPLAPGRYRLAFGKPGPALARVEDGDFVWISSDPRLTSAGARATRLGREPLGRIPVALRVRGEAGSALEVTASVMAMGGGASVTVASTTPLTPARGAGLSREMLADKLGAFGGTAYHLAGPIGFAGGEAPRHPVDDQHLAPALHVPVSELKELRRRVVAALDAAIARSERVVAATSQIAALRVSSTEDRIATAPEPIVVPLCRTDAQLDAVIAAGAREVELDWMELVGLGRAVERARRAGIRVGVATVRVQKPGEERIDAHLARLEPDHVLVRSWGSLAYFTQLAHPPVLHGDFSLNVANSITANWVLSRGLATVTAAHDLDRTQLLALLAHARPSRIAVTIHHHIPTFHTEHCVYAHLLSRGADYRTCGRPCEQHAVALRDRVGLLHPVVVDVGCRNTIFNAQAQSAGAVVPELIARGVSRLRVELVRETGAEAARLHDVYTRLAAGTATPGEALRAAAVHEQFGVTRGTMRTLTVLA